MCFRFLLLTVMVAFSGCASLLYAPTRVQYSDPKRFKLDYEEVLFNSTGSSEKLGAWYFPSRKGVPPRGLIVFFHGNGENMSSHYLALAWLPQHGFEFLIFDYRGYGPSEGEPSPRGTIQDGKAALRWAYAKAQAQGVPLLIFGQSLGGAVAMRTVLELKREIPIQGLILDSTFQSYQSIGSAVLRKNWFTWPFHPLAYVLLSDRWSPEGKVDELAPIPLLVIHGSEDEIVPIRFGRELKDQARDPKEYWEIPGGRHIDVFNAHDGKYRERFLAWLSARFPAGR